MLERFYYDEDAFFDYFREEENCKDFLEYMRWGGTVACVECGSLNVGGTRKTRWRCRDCRKLFSVTTGTIFENSPIALRKWYTAIFYYVREPNGYAVRHLKRRLKVTLRSAWFMHKRIQELFGIDWLEVLDGVHELDENWNGPLKHRMSKARYAKMKAGRGVTNRTPIPSLLTRGKRLYMRVVPRLSKHVVGGFVRELAQQGSTIFGDESPLYKQFNADYELHQFNHSKKKYGGGKYHSNTLEGSYVQLDDRFRTYKRITNRYKQNVVDEHTWNYSANNFEGLEENPIAKFELLFQNINRRISWRELMKKGDENEKMFRERRKTKPPVKTSGKNGLTWAGKVLRVLKKSDKPMKPSEIMVLIRQKGMGSGQSTDALSKRVSNALAALIKKKVVVKIDGKSMYVLAVQVKIATDLLKIAKPDRQN